MISIEDKISSALQEAVQKLWNITPNPSLLQIQKTKKEFEGDITVIVFPLLKLSKKSPEQTAQELGDWFEKYIHEISGFNVIKGFLNLSISDSVWLNYIQNASGEMNYGFVIKDTEQPSVMVEFSSPNTNKPLHLGHIRNNLLGHSVSKILDAAGRSVVKVNLVNDRGIHICKSMLAWEKFGNGETPASSGKKGDHLVGDYYVRFDTEQKKEISALISSGQNQEEAGANNQLMQEAREMLRSWETGDPNVVRLWEMMNSWVYDGFAETYKKLGVTFDKTYYESQTYKLGRELVLKGLNDGILYKKDDGSVWVDLNDEGLDHKLLLRSDGTSVYMTQDLGTAHQRFAEFNIDKHIYVVGNEQNYHFQVLKLVLKKLGYEWADLLYHLSYGMVELPEGKMKSREGKVVDADDLIDEMITTAREMSIELGKLDEIREEDREAIYHQIGMAALKYFILKVDPRKNMTFNPKESIDFNGNTGPFIQYTYARIMSVLRKDDGQLDSFKLLNQPLVSTLSEKERLICKIIYDYPTVIQSAAEELNPAMIANYLYDLAREFNQFYHEHSILKAEDESTRNFRLVLSDICAKIISSGMDLLGIEVPERM